MRTPSLPLGAIGRGGAEDTRARATFIATSVVVPFAVAALVVLAAPLGRGRIKTPPELAVLGTGAFAAWAAGVAALGMSDREKLLLPTRLVHLTAIVGGTLLAAGSASADDWHYFWRGIVCALTAATVFGPYALLRPAKLGFGDVRMAALVSAGAGALSPPGCFAAISTACFASALLRRVLIVSGRATGDIAAPLGFFLAISGIAAVVASAS